MKRWIWQHSHFTHLLHLYTGSMLDAAKIFKDLHFDCAKVRFAI